MASARLSFRSRNLHVLSFLLPMYKCNKFHYSRKYGSRPEVFCKKDILRPATLFKKVTLAQVFSVNFAKFLRALFLIEHLRWLLPKIVINVIERSLKGSVCRQSRPEIFLKKDFLKICSKFTGEHPCQSAISPVKLLHIFRTPFLKNTSGRLLLIGAHNCLIITDFSWAYIHRSR